MSAAVQEFQILPLEQLAESKTNPRQRYDAKGLEELTASVREHGVLVPLLVRPVDGAGRCVVPHAATSYEIVAGSRRYRAAKQAGLKDVPARVQALGDTEVLEIQVIENLQREDVHPLDEARGYHGLLKAGYSVERLSERVGRSIKYVYDRVKLLDLTKEAQALFLKDRITAGHAILLARLSPSEQQRAMDQEQGGLFTGERLLYTPHVLTDEDGDEDDPVKPVSVRELQSWIDRNVKFHPDKADPMLFPETVEAVQSATAEREKVLPITYEYMIPPEARDGSRVLTVRSWTRADGKHGSKPCEHATLAVVVVGPHRGEAFDVCVQKKKCRIHYGAEIRAAEKREKAEASGKPAVKDRWQEQLKQQEAEQRKRDAARARWEKAVPAILEAVAQAVKKAPTKATGLLGRILVDALVGYRGTVKGADLVPLGRTAEDLVRHAAFLVLVQEVNDSWTGPTQFPKRAKAFGLDVGKILDEVAPVKEAEPAKKAAAPAGPRRRKK